MNTGIGDAVNLSWKLAAVLRGNADVSVLDSYETERIAFAQTLVSGTDRAFRALVQDNLVGEVMRGLVFPHLLPLLFEVSAMRRLQFRFVSQTRINYRNSLLSEGIAGGVRGGDRLPWADATGGGNFAPLKSLDWQIHVYGQTGSGLRQAASDSRLALHRFAWSEQADRAGLERDAMYLVRPDGHVALADPKQDARKIRSFLSRFKIAPFQPTPG
jgi:hypothetical protein